MSPKQVIQEILRDYRANLSAGMNKEQSLDILKIMLLEMIEAEREYAYREGREVGQYEILWELKIKGADQVLQEYLAAP